MNRMPAVIALLALAGGGCTLIGLGIGSVVDRGKHDVEVAGWQFQEVNTGTELDLILKSGAVVTGTYLDRGVGGSSGSSSPKPPAASTIRLIVADRKVSFAIDDVGVVRIRAKKSGKLVGGLVGIGVDFAILLIAASQPSPPPPVCDPNLNYFCGGSCPFV